MPVARKKDTESGPKTQKLIGRGQTYEDTLHKSLETGTMWTESQRTESSVRNRLDANVWAGRGRLISMLRDIL